MKLITRCILGPFSYDVGITIRLNPHKCVFYISSSRLLIFLVSKYGIRINPLKFQAIIDLPTPSSLLQLQQLQGKANFLSRFVPNYAKLTKGFSHMLKKGVPFHWDDAAKYLFDALKDVLIRASMLYPPNYQHDYLLYLVTAVTTITMVLAQEDDGVTENPIYYLIQNLNDTEVKYTCIEKLALIVIQVVQRFCHYIMLLKTRVISDCNPMT